MKSQSAQVTLSCHSRDDDRRTRPVSVVLSTKGKFHTFDLARQLHRRGALASIFSGYPKFKLRNESLPDEIVKTFPWLHAPYMRFPLKSERLKRFWEWQDATWFDRHVSRHLPQCDVFCGMSGSSLETAKTAKRLNAKFVCDRGSSHIRFQDQLLREEHELQGIRFGGIDPRVIDREEAEYALADAITVPSMFALNSFVDAGLPPNKLQLVPYGVELARFRPVATPCDGEFRVLFVGSVSVRKGVVYLVEAFKNLEHRRKHLTFVGTITPSLADLVKEWTGRPDVSAVGPIQQSRLSEVMSRSHVMVLPSTEEGLALVQAQAMACGCPVIASTNTGAADLFTDGVEGFIVPIRDSDTIAHRLQTLADNPARRKQMSAAALRRVQSVDGWSGYGESMYRVFEDVART